MKPVKVHPIRSESIILWGDDSNKENTLVKGKNCVGSVIGFDKRQIWTVYPYKRKSTDTRYCGECERNGVCIRLMPKDFCRIFGTNPFDAQAGSEDKLDGNPIDIDKTVEHYEGTLETLKGIDLEDKA